MLEDAGGQLVTLLLPSEIQRSFYLIALRKLGNQRAKLLRKEIGKRFLSL